MPVGEVGFTTRGKQAQKGSFEPFAPGDYTLTLVGSTVEIKTGSGPGKLPYINASFVAQGTALTEDGKDRRVWHKFFLSLEPGKDGVVNVERANQLLGFVKSLGEDFEVGGDDILKANKADDKGEMTKVSIINPRVIAEWLKQHDGMEVRAHVRIRKGTKDYPNDQNEVAYFIEADAAGYGEDDVTPIKRKAQ